MAEIQDESIKRIAPKRGVEIYFNTFEQLVIKQTSISASHADEAEGEFVTVNYEDIPAFIEHLQSIYREFKQEDKLHGL